jgi:hypothetical protein
LPGGFSIDLIDPGARLEPTSLSIMASASLNGRQLMDICYASLAPSTFMQPVSFIRLHLFEGNFSVCLLADSLSMLRRDVKRDWMEETRWEGFLGASTSVRAKSFERSFICLMILIILTRRISRTALVPSLAALEALEICEILAALFPAPEIYWEIQMRSSPIVAVLMMSSQK